MEGVNILIQAGLAFKNVGALAEAALDAGADWLDVQFDPRSAAVLETLQSKIETANRCFVTQGGFHPGIPAALVRWAATQVDELETADVIGVLRPKGGMQYTEAVEELTDLFRDYQAHLWRDGAWQRVTGVKASDYKTFNTAFGMGRNRGAPLDLDEMKPLPQMFPTIREMGMYVAGFGTFGENAAAMIMLGGLKLLPWVKGATWGRFYCWATRTFAKQPYGVAVQLDAQGIRAGKAVDLRLALFHDDGYELTAIPVVAMLEQMLDGSAHQAGLFRMGLLVHPEPMLAAVEQMGVKVFREIK